MTLKARAPRGLKYGSTQASSSAQYGPIAMPQASQ